MKLTAAVMIAAVPLAGWGQYPAYPPPADAPPAYAPGPRRSPWYIGFGLGGGDGGLRAGGSSYTFREWNFDQALTTWVFNFKVGATLSPKLLLGFDLTSFCAETGDSLTCDVSGDSSLIPGATRVTNYDAVATWFPQGEGLFFRGGLGLTALRDEVTLGGVTYRNAVQGGNFLAGVGYAFWIGRTFNLTLDLDYSAQSYSSSDPAAPTSSHFWAAWVGFDWY